MTDIAGRRQKGRPKTSWRDACKRHGHCGSQHSRGGKQDDPRPVGEMPVRDMDIVGLNTGEVINRTIWTL